MFPGGHCSKSSGVGIVTVKHVNVSVCVEWSKAEKSKIKRSNKGMSNMKSWLYSNSSRCSAVALSCDVG